MISIFLREQQRYNKDDLVSMFKSSQDEIIKIIRRLKEYGILKTVKRDNSKKDLNDLVDEEIAIIDVYESSDKLHYVFTFVGIIVVQGYILKCYPKYLLESLKPVSELKQVLKVLEKYNSSQQIISIFNETNTSSSFNILAITLYLVNDYHENGSYINTHDVLEVNGDGEILWEKTINETFTLLANDRPFYPELYTKKRTNDEHDYFKRLHECVVSKCSKDLENADLLNLFDLLEVEVSDEEIDNFGEKEYILEQLQCELNVQFNTRKQSLLKMLYTYISQEKSLDNENNLSIFGTNSFNLVWEKICAEILDNKLKQPLGNILLPTKLCEKYDKKEPLYSIVEKPIWHDKNKLGEDYEMTSHKTLELDIVSIYQNNELWNFAIFDAKYYNLQFEEGVLSGQPGIESITKQYLYQLAFANFIAEHKFDKVINCFLLPTPGQEIIDKGYVELKMLSTLKLENILVKLLPATKVYKLYLTNSKMDINDFGM